MAIKKQPEHFRLHSKPRNKKGLATEARPHITSPVFAARLERESHADADAARTGKQRTSLKKSGLVAVALGFVSTPTGFVVPVT
jgi:hypothetical protein